MEKKYPGSVGEEDFLCMLLALLSFSVTVHWGTEWLCFANYYCAYGLNCLQLCWKTRLLFFLLGFGVSRPHCWAKSSPQPSPGKKKNTRIERSGECKPSTIAKKLILKCLYHSIIFKWITVLCPRNNSVELTDSEMVLFRITVVDFVDSCTVAPNLLCIFAAFRSRKGQKIML